MTVITVPNVSYKLYRWAAKIEVHNQPTFQSTFPRFCGKRNILKQIITKRFVGTIMNLCIDKEES